MKLFIKKPQYKYVGDKIEDGSLILSNHVGTSAPLALELYLKQPVRFWGAWQMNGNLFQVYGYQTKTYYHEKKHWNLFLARLFCIIASPLTWIFYRGLRLIPTYKDSRLRKTLSMSIEAIKNKENVVIFPEDSAKGYLDKLEGFFAGFVLLAKMCLKEGIDLPIHLAYYKKKDKVYVVDKKILFSELVNMGLSQEQIAEKLCNRVNELADMSFEDKVIEEDEVEVLNQ
jgi:hypothetical protein